VRGFVATPTAHLIHGYLGAGKTTFAKRLAAETGAVRYSPDELMVARHGHDPPERHFWSYFAAIAAEIEAEWPRTLASGQSVVLDFGFWTRARRDAARSRAAAVGARARLYCVRCSEETARQRCHARNQNLGSSLFVADATFETLKARFEPLSPDEPFVLVDTEE
jgi:predicted kinase